MQIDLAKTNGTSPPSTEPPPLSGHVFYDLATGVVSIRQAVTQSPTEFFLGTLDARASFCSRHSTEISHAITLAVVRRPLPSSPFGV